VSSDATVLRVDESAMTVSALQIGRATITAYPGDEGPTSPCAVSVSLDVTAVHIARLELFPSELDLELGSVAAVNLQAFDKRSRSVPVSQVDWIVSPNEVAVVEEGCAVRGLTQGRCDVVARVTNADGSVCEVHLPVRVRRAAVSRLTLNAERTMVETGETLAVRAVAWDTLDAVVGDAVPVWRSTHPDIARVTADGMVTALMPGRVTIIAEHEGKSGQLALLVSPAPVVSLRITPESLEAVVGTAVSFAVSGTDRNGQSMVPSVQWIVDPADAATITADGRLTPRREGSLSVVATIPAPSDATGILSGRSGVTATAVVTVSPAPERVVAASAEGSASRKSPLLLVGGVAVVGAVAWLLWPAGNGQVEPPLPPQPDTTVVVAKTTPAESATVVGPALPPPVDSSPKTAGTGSPSNVVVRDSAKAKPPVVAPSRQPIGSGVAAGRTTVAGPTGGGSTATVNANRASSPPAPTPVPSSSVAAPSTSSATTAKGNESQGTVAAPAVATSAAPPVAPPAAAAPVAETPSGSELREVAEQIVRLLRQGGLRPTADIRQFFNDGAEHKVALAAAPNAAALTDGKMQTQFDVTLTRFNAAGALERRATTVRIEVAKRNGAVQLLSTSFAPLAKSAGK
jgi:hypothetical protein